MLHDVRSRVPSGNGQGREERPQQQPRQRTPDRGARAALPELTACMALFLKNAAAARANKPIPSAYYDGLPGNVGRSGGGGKERSNPVLQKLEQEIGTYAGYMRKRASPGYEKPAEEAYSRPSDVLFELWNKYEPLLPKEYFHRRLLEMGDLLVSLQQYALAERQCYSRYLDAFGDVNVELISDVESFKKTFFPDGFQADEAGFTFRALMGRSICMFQTAKTDDPMLLNSATVQRCLRILSFLRFVTQVVLPTDSLCWLVYNGTVHIYSICRHLMAFGNSAVVLEYLLWASACMETSVPLLAVKYLPWRTTLYTAVCQCYYDCKASAFAEAFARRALVKINELSHLEAHSSAVHGPETAAVFRQATVKMAIMVFKRTAFESRRKPKGLLRPKVRANMKDYINLPWPRTPTEKLLVDMFEGSAAQLLCLVETLSDSNRRTLVTSPPAPDGEVEILDVYAELFFAAQEIICGGGGSHMYATPVTIPNRATGLVSMPGIVHGKSLIEMAANGQDGVPLSAVIKLVKLAFCYEQWDVYDAMVTNVYNYVKGLGGDAYLPDLMALELMMAMEQLNSGRRRKHELEAAEREREKEKEREKQERRHAAAAAAAAAAGSLSDAGGPTPTVARTVDAAVAALDPGRGPESTAAAGVSDDEGMPGGRRKKAAGRGRGASSGAGSGAGERSHPRRSRAPAATGSQRNGDATGRDEHLKEASSSSMMAMAAPLATNRSFVSVDDLVTLAKALRTIATSSSVTPANFDLDMVNDSVLFLWSKCKGVFQKYQTGSNDNVKYLRKMENPNKWVFALEVVHQVIGWCSLSHVDPALTAEVTLRLALVMEASAAAKSATSARMTSVTYDSDKDVDDDISQHNNLRYGAAMSTNSVAEPEQSSVQYAGSSTSTVLLKRTTREQLSAARDILEQGLRNVSMARQLVALNDGGSIADIGWDKNLVKALANSSRSVVLEKDATASGSLSNTQQQISFSEIGLHSSTSKADDQTSLVASYEAKIATDGAVRTEQASFKSRTAFESKPQYDTSVWVTVKDLHMEMYFMYFKVCVKLSQLGALPTASSKSHRSARSTATSDRRDGQSSAAPSVMHGPTASVGDDQITHEQLLSVCGKNSLVRAMLLIQQAAAALATTSQCRTGASAAAEQLGMLEEAAVLIGKAQAEEKRLHADNHPDAGGSQRDTVGKADEGHCSPSDDVPSPPVLLSRCETGMVFRPAAFKPRNGEKVAWYRLFCRPAAGSNVKVRLNDSAFPGCGDEVPAFRCQLRVGGLKPQERYVFAVAAYTADGRLVGNSIGETSRPLLAALPLPVLLCWSYLAQVSYQVCQYTVTKRAAQVLWEHFTVGAGEDDRGKLAVANMPTVETDFRLTLPRLDKVAVEAASPLLLRAFLSSVFAMADVQTREHALYCDHLCDMPGSCGPAPAGSRQVARLRECERLLVAVEVACWLNDSGAALQAVVCCYGLLAPLVYWRIPSTATVQVLERCHIVLQEVPVGSRQRRSDRVSESLHHMVACVTYYLAKVLRSRGHKALANRLTEAGRRLLTQHEDGTAGAAAGKLEKSAVADGYAKDDRSDNGAGGSADDADDTDEGMLTLAALKKKKAGKAAKSNNAKEDEAATGNSELKALEAHLLRLSKQAQGEQELTGNEDPSILHAYIAFLPSRIAYREVVKFKRRARYLEFVVQVVQKAVTEGLSQLAAEWCEETLSWIAKRNETVAGSKAIFSKQLGAVAIQGDDPKKFAAAVVEFTRQKELLSPRTKGNPSGKQRRKPKFKIVSVATGLSPEERAQQEERQIRAIEKLALHLPDQFKQATRRRRLRKVCADELSWRSQLNLVLGLSHFRTFLNKLELREKVLGTRSSLVYSTSFLDPEWFTFETAGVLVAGLIDAGAASQHHRNDHGVDDGWADGSGPHLPSHRAVGVRSRHVAGTGGGKFKSKAGPVGRSDAEHTQRRNTGIERAAAASTGAVPQPLFPVVEQKRDSPRTASPTGASTAAADEEQKGGADAIGMSSSAAVDTLTLTFGYFCRAVVLAHRGQHWAVMQNAVYALWNCYHTAIMRATTYDSSNLSAVGASTSGLLSREALSRAVLPSLYLTCDHWLDMLFIMEAEQARRSKADRTAAGSAVVGGTADSGAASFWNDVEDEKGGASLKFEPLLDDCTAVDLRFTRRLVGCTMELLFRERKWEKVVHVCLRFLALTGTRFVEQFVPMLVVAQRNLAEQLVLAGEFVPQPHMLLAQERCGAAEITPRVYATQLELRLPVATDEKGVARVVCHKSDDAPRIDPFAPAVVSDNTLAKKLSSVPVDFKASLKLYQDVMSRATYNARALRHSRQLLVLYLGGLQQVAVSEVMEAHPELQFSPHTAQPQSAVPPDPRTQSFATTGELQKVVLSRPQLEVVISSYEKTIEMLLAHNQKALAAQALHEVGNLAYHNRNTRGAYKWWCDALDLLLNINDAVSSWRTALSKLTDVPRELLARCGVWGCLLGGVLTSNISQYIMTSNHGLRTDCCYLSAHFFKAVLRASQPHPTADKDYASYDIGEGCDVAYLVPGIDFLSDRFRADGRGVLAALRWVAEELSRARHHLFVLPLLTLYQYFASNVCRDLQRTVDSRILRVRVLTDLALFRDAAATLLRLLHGDRLPNLGDSAFRQVESRMPPLQFDTTKPLSDAGNRKMLELLMDKRLSTALSSLYGPHLTCQLTIAQSRLLVAIADSLPVVPLFDLRDKVDSSKAGPASAGAADAPAPAPGRGVAAAPVGTAISQTTLPPSHPPAVTIGAATTVGMTVVSSSDAAASTKPVQPEQQQQQQQLLTLTSADAVAGASNVTTGVLTPSESAPGSASTQSRARAHDAGRFSGAGGEFLQEKCKGLLLDTAEMMLTTIGDTLLDAAAEDGGMESARPAELEMWVQCQLSMSAVAQQRHHASLAARAAFDALKMLMNSDVFAEKKVTQNMTAGRKSSMKGGSGFGAARSGAYGSVKLTDEQNNQFEFHNYQSRSRLDARLWLECKLTLVKSMLGKNGGMGLIKGPITKVVVEMADCRQYCAEGIAEAEACNDAELQAEFLMQAALLNVTEGLSIHVTRGVVEDAVALLQTVPCLSTAGSLLSAQLLLLLSDIDCLLGGTVASGSREKQQQRVPAAADSLAVAERTLGTVADAHDRILAQMLLLGCKVRIDAVPVRLQAWSVHAPSAPLPNIYLPHVPLLCQARLRASHLAACQGALLDRLQDCEPRGAGESSGLRTPPQLYRSALDLATPTLELCRAGARCPPALLAELLLETGKLQRHLSTTSPSSSSRTELDASIIILLEAISVSHGADHNLSFIRQGYLEIAMAYLSVSSQAYSSKRVPSAIAEAAVEADPTSLDLTASFDGGTASPSSMSAAAEDRGVKAKKKKGTVTQASTIRERTRLKKAADAEEEREKLAAMLAIRCAALTTQAQYNALMINGDGSALPSPKLAADEWQSMPQFAFLDLVGDYVIGKKKKVYKDWVEEQMAPLVESMLQEPVPTYEEDVSLALLEARDVGWVSLLGYQSILQRMCNHRTVAVKQPSSRENDINTEKDDTEGAQSAGVDLADSDGCDVAMAVHYPLFCGSWSLRVGYMHRFFADKLAAYKERCVAPLPPAGLRPTPPAAATAATTAGGGAASANQNSRLLFSSSASLASAAVSSALDVPPADQAAPGSSLSSAVAALSNSLSLGAGRSKEKSSLQQQPPPLPDNELCVQWYVPPYERPPLLLLPRDQMAPSDGSGSSSSRCVYLLYAASKKDKDWRGSKARYLAGMVNVPTSPLSELHERLVDLVQKAEILLVDKANKKGSTAAVSVGATSAGAAAAASTSLLQTSASTAAMTVSPSKAKGAGALGSRSRLLKAQSPKLRKDEAIETLLRQCMLDIYQVFGATMVLPQATQQQQPAAADSTDGAEQSQQQQAGEQAAADETPRIPFEITVGNLKSLERLFNISFGNIISSGKLFAWLYLAVPSDKVS